MVKAYLHNTSVKDADLAALRQLSKLRNLFLGKTQIGDEGLEYLQKLSGRTTNAEPEFDTHHGCRFGTFDKAEKLEDAQSSRHASNRRRSDPASKAPRHHRRTVGRFFNVLLVPWVH